MESLTCYSPWRRTTRPAPTDPSGPGRRKSLGMSSKPQTDRRHDRGGPPAVAVVDLGEPGQPFEGGRSALVAQPCLHADEEVLPQIDVEAEVEAEHRHRALRVERHVIDEGSGIRNGERDERLGQEARSPDHANVRLEPPRRRDVEAQAGLDSRLLV